MIDATRPVSGLTPSVAPKRGHSTDPAPAPNPQDSVAVQIVAPKKETVAATTVAPPHGGDVSARGDEGCRKASRHFVRRAAAHRPSSPALK